MWGGAAAGCQTGPRSLSGAAWPISSRTARTCSPSSRTPTSATPAARPAPPAPRPGLISDRTEAGKGAGCGCEGSESGRRDGASRVPCGVPGSSWHRSATLADRQGPLCLADLPARQPGRLLGAPGTVSLYISLCADYAGATVSKRRAWISAPRVPQPTHPAAGRSCCQAAGDGSSTLCTAVLLLPSVPVPAAVWTVGDRLLRRERGCGGGCLDRGGIASLVSNPHPVAVAVLCSPDDG